MPWYEREQRTPFDEKPITGLSFLHGDVAATVFHQERLRGKKYPLISFPSGVQRELASGDDAQTLHLFGSVDLPLAATQREALELLFGVGAELGLKFLAAGNETLIVMNAVTGRAYNLHYDQEGHQLQNITLSPDYAMEVLPGDLRAMLPPIDATIPEGLNAIAPIKFFTPDANWTWYPTEFDSQDTFFGLVCGHALETGLFSLAELEQVRGSLGLPIERDLWYKPKTLLELQDLHRRGEVG